MVSKKKVAYTKPKVIAQNSVAGSFAAGCPANNGTAGNCASGSNRQKCELSR